MLPIEMDTVKGHGNKHSTKQESPTTEHAKKARTLEIVNHTCQALKPVGGGGGGRLGAYQCRSFGDGEGAGDDLSRALLSSNGVGVCVYLVSLGWSPFHRSDREEGGRSSRPSSARLVAPPLSIRPPPPPRRQPFQTAGGEIRSRREIRDSPQSYVSIRGFDPRDKGCVSISRRIEGDWEEIGRGGILGGFNRKHRRKEAGLNPSESDPDCQTGIGARSRPGWDETN
jgi:hypothetical protein